MLVCSQHPERAHLLTLSALWCSTIQLPSTSYPLFDSLPDHIVSQGKLSQLQLEGVLYACSKHQEILPSGKCMQQTAGRQHLQGIAWEMAHAPMWCMHTAMMAGAESLTGAARGETAQTCGSHESLALAHCPCAAPCCVRQVVSVATGDTIEISSVSLPGQRAGFFIGDGAGVGKGRQIAGIVLDNYARGRRRAVWVSTSTVRL